MGTSLGGACGWHTRCYPSSAAGNWEQSDYDLSVKRNVLLIKVTSPAVIPVMEWGFISACGLSFAVGHPLFAGSSLMVYLCQVQPNTDGHGWMWPEEFSSVAPHLRGFRCQQLQMQSHGSSWMQGSCCCRLQPVTQRPCKGPGCSWCHFLSSGKWLYFIGQLAIDVTFGGFPSLLEIKIMVESHWTTQMQEPSSGLEYAIHWGRKLLWNFSIHDLIWAAWAPEAEGGNPSTLEPGALGQGKGTFSMAFRGHIGQVMHVPAVHWQHYKARKGVSGELS